MIHASRLPLKVPAFCSVTIAALFSLAICATLSSLGGSFAEAQSGRSGEGLAVNSSVDSSGDGPRPAAGKNVALLHTPPKPGDIPYPGQPMTLVATLTNTRDTNFPMRVALSRDGKFLEMAARDAYLDKNDRPTYEIVVPAPVAELTYQMFAVPREGQAISSPRFAVRRTCIPQVELAEGQVSAEVQGIERLRKLVNESRSLEQDLAGYQQSLKILSDLKGVLGQ